MLSLTATLGELAGVLESHVYHLLQKWDVN
jgi:hypothetical protein